MLTAKIAKQFGRKQVLLATAIPFICLFSIGLYYETRGDFSNGILFFVDALLNIRVILFFILIAAMSYLFGGTAGIEIMIRHKNFALTSLKYAIIISLSVLLYSCILNYISKTFERENIGLFIVSQLWVFVPFILIWLWSGNRMRLKANTNI